MPTQEHLLQRLEYHMERLGDEFQAMSDDYFGFGEEELRCRLFALLWQDSELVHEFQHELGDGRVREW